MGCWVKAKKKIQCDFLPVVGGRYEEERKDKSFEGSPEEKKCQKILETIKGREKIPHLIR